MAGTPNVVPELGRALTGSRRLAPTKIRFNNGNVCAKRREGWIGYDDHAGSSFSTSGHGPAPWALGVGQSIDSN